MAGLSPWRSENLISAVYIPEISFGVDDLNVMAKNK
jgi:hypothetical protein